MGTLLTFRNWLLGSVLWIAFVAYLAWQGWPRIPFDVANDSATAAALRSAINTHALVHAGLALVPPAIAYIVGRMICRARGSC